MKGEPIDDVAIRMADGDNVLMALADLSAGRAVAVDGRVIVLSEDVAFGHKFAIEWLEPGDKIRKYGEVIGKTTASIEPGEWVHTHNCESMRGQPSSDTLAPEEP